MNIAIYMPKFGFTTGEMPHVRNPPKNYMPGQNLYYLWTACQNLGYNPKVIDGNWSKDPLQLILDFKPEKVLISTATPTYHDTLKMILSLRESGYAGEIFIGGPHVSLNLGQRDFLLRQAGKVVYVPLINSLSTFDWVETVFPDRSRFEVLNGLNAQEAKDYICQQHDSRSGAKLNKHKLEQYLFTYFKPSMDWMKKTYHGDHIDPNWAKIPIRYSIITSIGCSKTCSFCANPFIYKIGFKTASVVREIVQDYKRNGIHRLSVHDMYFVMYEKHAREMMEVFRSEEMTYSMQTCLENLDDAMLDDLKSSGLQKFLVGIENPVSHTVGKTVTMDRLHWLLSAVKLRKLAGVKLSYIVGLPGVELGEDIQLLKHIVEEVRSTGHPLEDLQVNLYTPYRPEPHMDYLAYEKPGDLPIVAKGDSRTIMILTKIPFSFWGSFPVGVSQREDLRKQMILCDITFEKVYWDFKEKYLEIRQLYLEELNKHYPELMAYIPSYEESINLFDNSETLMSLESLRIPGNAARVAAEATT